MQIYCQRRCEYKKYPLVHEKYPLVHEKYLHSEKKVFELLPSSDRHNF